MELQNSITKENLGVLMTSFYRRVIVDPALSHFFTDELGDDLHNEDWTVHIELLTEFWVAELLGEDTYRGNVFGMHTRVQHIQRDSFARWMEIFVLCLNEAYTIEIADHFRNKAEDLSIKFIDFLKI